MMMALHRRTNNALDEFLRIQAYKSLLIVCRVNNGYSTHSLLCSRRSFALLCVVLKCHLDTRRRWCPDGFRESLLASSYTVLSGNLLPKIDVGFLCLGRRATQMLYCAET